MQIAESPFAVLTAVVAPALLTNSSTVLVLGLGNRIARVIDRTRTVAAVMARVDPNSELYQRLQEQRGHLKQRSQMLSKALRLGYAAVGAFAAEALIAVLGGVLVHDGFNLAARIAGMIALAIGFGSVGSLVCACVYMVHETALALDNLAEEANTVMLESAQHPPQR
jgi:ribonuclease PH